MIGATGTISKSFRLPEQHIGKARNKKPTKNINFGHCTRTSEVRNYKYRACCTCEIALHVA